MRKIECETYDRCCGYYRPIQQMNAGIKEQIRQRKRFKVPEYTDKKVRTQRNERTVEEC